MSFSVRAESSPGPGQVRVRVRAAGVAFGDVIRRRGLVLGRQKLPFIPGYDVVGIVDATGKGVHRVREGDCVAALVFDGGYSTSLVLSEELVARVPPNVNDLEVACLVLNYVSARQMLRWAALPGPSPILVHGAAGGVGSALVELARLEGHSVWGTASAAKHDVVRRMGATPIDYRSCDFVTESLAVVPEGMAAVFDGIGGQHLDRSLRTLARRGRLIGFGFSSVLDRGPIAIRETLARIARQAIQPWGPSARFYGIGMPPVSTRKRIDEDLRELLELLANGRLSPRVGRVLPFEQVVEAHKLLEQGAVTGKIVLSMPET